MSSPVTAALEVETEHFKNIVIHLKLTGTPVLVDEL